MKKILLWDCETTGLPNFNLRARDPQQPHMVQVSASMYYESGELAKGAFTTLVKPDGWTISPEMEAIHGVSNEMALASGVDEKQVASELLGWVKEADYISSFNLTFDKFILRCALRRFDLMTDADDAYWKSKPGICVMRKLQPICGLGKFPKLSEACRHLFGEELVGAHNANDDRAALVRCFFWLVEKGHVNL